MHEYTLFSQIPATRHDQVLNILAGVTGAQPFNYNEQHCIYAQQHDVKPATIKKQKQQQSSQGRSYERLIRPLESEPGSHDDLPWVLRSEQTPEPGSPAVISRGVTESNLRDSDAVAFGDPSKYRLTAQYIASGHRFIQNNTIIRIYRILPYTSETSPLLRAPPVVAELTPLDPSGAYIVEACIRVEDRSNARLNDQATKELLEFKKTLDGAIDLHVPDRLALDTRVKGV